jgi:hypothetical protein
LPSSSNQTRKEAPTSCTRSILHTKNRAAWSPTPWPWQRDQSTCKTNQHQTCTAARRTTCELGLAWSRARLRPTLASLCRVPILSSTQLQLVPTSTPNRNHQQHCYPCQRGLHVRTTESRLMDMFEPTSNMDMLDVNINYVYGRKRLARVNSAVSSSLHQHARRLPYWLG